MLSTAALVAVRSRLIAENAPRLSDFTQAHWTPQPAGAGGVRVPSAPITRHAGPGAGGILGMDPTSLVGPIAVLLGGAAIMMLQKQSMLGIARALLDAASHAVHEIVHDISGFVHNLVSPPAPAPAPVPAEGEATGKAQLPSADQHPIAPRNAVDELRDQQAARTVVEGNQVPSPAAPPTSSPAPRSGSAQAGVGAQAPPAAPPRAPAPIEATGSRTPVVAPQVRPSSSVRPMAPLAGGRATIGAVIQKAAELTGVPVSLMLTFAGMESNFDPNAGATSSSAKGLFQFIKGTWATMVQRYGAKYGIGINDIMDPFANATMAALLMKESIAHLKGIGISRPNAVDLYLEHLLGPTAAATFFRNLDKLGAQVLQSAAAANRAIFYDHGRPRTNREIYQYLADRMFQVNAGLASSKNQIEEQYQRLESSGWAISPKMASEVARARTVAQGDGGGAPSHRPVAIADGHITADQHSFFG